MSTLSASCTCIYSIRLCHIAFEPQALWLSLFVALHEAGEILAGVGRAPRSFPARWGAVGTRTGSRRVCHNPTHFPCDPAGTTPRCRSAVICSKKHRSYKHTSSTPLLGTACWRGELQLAAPSGSFCSSSARCRG